MDKAYEEALGFYKALDINVIELGYREKRPPLVHPGADTRKKWETYQHRTSTDAEQDYWFGGKLPANLGVVTGNISGLIVVDCDDEDSYREVLEAMPWLLETVTVKTGHGYHIYIRPTTRDTPTYTFRVNGTLNHIKAEGGYVVAPPSVHPEGATYERIGEHEYLKEVDPDILRFGLESQGWLEKVRPDRGTVNAGPVSDWVAVMLAEPCESGQRNVTAAKLAGWFRNVILKQAVTLEIMRQWNELQCAPPLDDHEVIATVRSIYKTTDDPPWASVLRD